MKAGMAMEQLLMDILQLSSHRLQEAESILMITEDVKIFIQQQDVESINKAIDLREGKMEKINAVNTAVDEKMEELYERFAIKKLSELNLSKYPQVEKIFHDEQQTKTVYRQTSQLEESNFRSIKILLEEYKEAIKGIHKNKRALKIYGSNSGTPSILINELK